ncbi:AAA family ATPase [Janthinobacterium sp. LB3P112]|uniref:AAA family ATPase n=1 Tax=Janthinobacterium sp. LB3P112 TaxID=3424196 RepID=UPI003F205579
MEHLKIENFLTVKNAEIEIKSINILIGPQASGKSVIAKLVYFFKTFIAESIIDAARENLARDKICKNAISDFCEIFPKYSWDGQHFLIEYKLNDVLISIKNFDKNESGNLKIYFEYSKIIDQVKKKIVVAARRNESELEIGSDMATSKIFKNPEMEFLSLAKEQILRNLEIGFLEHSTFIPAGRSFFSNLQKNVFSFLAGNIPIDPFLKEFGSAYERSKSLLRHRPDFLRGRDISLVEIDNLIESILKGRYKYADGQDWIESERCKLNAANSSSGQQEALPMLVVLSLLPFFYGEDKKNIFFIEEPEAHLFPEAQQKIVKIITSIYNLTDRNNRFFITTHSPYVLSVFNSSILASEVIKNPINSKAWKYASSQWKNSSINFDEVTAYSVENGVVKCILDKELRLIDANAIDGASDDINSDFDNLLNLKYANS